MDTAYCVECRARRRVEDVSYESEYRFGREQHWRVQWLDCGHHREWDQGTTDTAPGAPYAPGAAPTRHALVRLRAMHDPFLDPLDV